jgi:hypothetical protein
MLQFGAKCYKDDTGWLSLALAPLVVVVAGMPEVHDGEMFNNMIEIKGNLDFKMRFFYIFMYGIHFFLSIFCLHK